MQSKIKQYDKDLFNCFVNLVFIDIFKKVTTILIPDLQITPLIRN